MIKVSSTIRTPLVTCGYTIAYGETIINDDKNETGLLAVLMGIEKQVQSRQATIKVEYHPHN